MIQTQYIQNEERTPLELPLLRIQIWLTQGPVQGEAESTKTVTPENLQTKANSNIHVDALWPKWLRPTKMKEIIPEMLHLDIDQHLQDQMNQKWISFRKLYS